MLLPLPLPFPSSIPFLLLSFSFFIFLLFFHLSSKQYGGNVTGGFGLIGDLEDRVTGAGDFAGDFDDLCGELIVGKMTTGAGGVMGVGGEMGDEGIGGTGGTTGTNGIGAGTGAVVRLGGRVSANGQICLEGASKFLFYIKKFVITVR
jgi:hypothetical protein